MARPQGSGCKHQGFWQSLGTAGSLNRTGLLVMLFHSPTWVCHSLLHLYSFFYRVHCLPPTLLHLSIRLCWPRVQSSQGFMGLWQYLTLKKQYIYSIFIIIHMINRQQNIYFNIRKGARNIYTGERPTGCLPPLTSCQLNRKFTVNLKFYVIGKPFGNQIFLISQTLFIHPFFISK